MVYDLQSARGKLQSAIIHANRGRKPVFCARKLLCFCCSV